MSTSMPSAARPCTAIEPAARSTPAPIRPSRSTKAASPCNGAATEPGHGDPASRDGGRRPQVRGRGRVRLDQVVGPAVAAGADGHRSLPHRHVVDAERGHHGLRDGQVGAGDQRGGQLDLDAPLGGGGDEHEGGHELARDVAREGDRAAAEAAGRHDDREVAPATRRARCPRRARPARRAAAPSGGSGGARRRRSGTGLTERGQRGDEARRRAGESGVELDRTGPQCTGRPHDQRRRRVRVHPHVGTQAGDGVEHGLGVVREADAPEGAGAARPARRTRAPGW